MAAAATLPRWDMTPLFPSLDSPEFAAGFQQVEAALTSLRDLFDQEGIDAHTPAPLTDAQVQTAERAIAGFNALWAHAQTLGAYIQAFVSTESQNTTAQAKLSEFQGLQVQLALLTTRFTAWIGSLDVEALIARSTVAADHAHVLRQAKIQATHLMSPAEEALAAELNVTGGGAWERLYDNFTSQINVLVWVDGKPQELPMSAVRNLAYSPDRATRQQAYEAELASWARHSMPIASALNSIKGQMNMLSAKRGWATPLDAAIFGASIDRETLDAMMGAAREAFPDFRRYLRAKAKALGLEKLAFYDIFAPVGSGGRSWNYEESIQFVINNFGDFAPKMRAFAERAVREQWIDAEPRAGKRGGAFCMGVRADESRVMTNFQPSYEGMSTLAHELGHGYHNLNLGGRTMLQRDTPMTLAETASIFCETLVKEAAIKTAAPADQMEIIESFIGGACQVVVDITSRFLFEQRVFAQRQQRELSVDELCAIMRQAQIETYGDGLDEAQLHPYMWAAKPHYYSPDLSFYNFPYMFGLLFGLGLYARYKQDPAAFRQGYDDLLSSTGLADAATLAARFDIDLHSPDFWRASLDVIRADIARFEQLVG